MKIFLPDQTLQLVKNKYIFIDTCFLLDLINLDKKEREEVISALLFIKTDCELLTMESVAIEFCLGSTKEELLIKRACLNELMSAILPINTIERKTIEELIIEYDVGARGTSYVDLSLAAAIKQFPKSLVLTRNYKDFPLRIFNNTAAFCLFLNKEVRTYCFYEYCRQKQKEKEENVPF